MPLQRFKMIQCFLCSFYKFKGCLVGLINDEERAIVVERDNILLNDGMSDATFDLQVSIAQQADHDGLHLDRM